MYGSFHTYQIVPQTGFSVVPGNRFPKTEKNYAAETAVRYTGKSGGSIEGILFWQEAYQLYRPGYFVEEPGIVYSQTYGYQNAPGLAMAMWGFQGIIRTKSGILDLSINKKEVPLDNRLELFTQYTRGREWFGFVCRLPMRCATSPNGTRSTDIISRPGENLNWYLRPTASAPVWENRSFLRSYIS
jgi:hypothetical protein